MFGGYGEGVPCELPSDTDLPLDDEGAGEQQPEQQQAEAEEHREDEHEQEEAEDEVDEDVESERELEQEEPRRGGGGGGSSRASGRGRSDVLQDARPRINHQQRWVGRCVDTGPDGWNVRGHSSGGLVVDNTDRLDVVIGILLKQKLKIEINRGLIMI